MHTPVHNFKTLFPAVYLGLVAACLLLTLPALFTDSFSYCSGDFVSVCFPYGLIGLILLHFPIAFALQPLITLLEGQQVYPGLAIIFFLVFLLDLAITFTLGALVDRLFHRPSRSAPPPSSTASLVNPLHLL